MTKGCNITSCSEGHCIITFVTFGMPYVLYSHACCVKYTKAHVHACIVQPTFYCYLLCIVIESIQHCYVAMLRERRFLAYQKVLLL